MQHLKFLALIISLAGLTACATPAERAANAQQRAYEAQEKVARERLKLVDKYQDCVKQAAGDAGKADACAS